MKYLFLGFSGETGSIKAFTPNDVWPKFRIRICRWVVTCTYENATGGFSYWPGQNTSDDWGTSYAGHFLLEAEKKGYVLPIGFKSSWIRYQRNAAKQWRTASNRSDLAQAYRVYTLALSGNADVPSMNRLRESGGISDEAKFRLAATYALIGQAGVAKDILGRARLDFDGDNHSPYTYGSPERNRAMALETYVVLGEKTKAQDLAKTVAKRLSEDQWMSTQSTAQVYFKGRDGTRLNVGQMPQGTDFVAEVILTNLTGNAIKNMALTEIFPSGWEIINTRFTDFGDFAQNEVTHTDLRDDRANFYFDMKKNETKTFRILVDASYLGRYYLPGIQAEAMYNHDFMVRTKGQWVEVVQE